MNERSPSAGLQGQALIAAPQFFCRSEFFLNFLKKRPAKTSSF
jgi:hypothetical protein